MATSLTILVVVVPALLLSTSPTVLCCIEPSLILVEGPGLSRQLEISDPRAVSLFEPWREDFAEWNVDLEESPPRLSDSYRIYVYTDASVGPGGTELTYVFYYHPNDRGRQGLVYVPGWGEAWYHTNVSTVIGGWEGEWHPARQEPDATLRTLIRSAVAASENERSGARTPTPEAAVIALLAVSIAGIMILARQRSTT